MTGPADQEFPLPAALAEYAGRLLLGTGLDASGAVLIASGQRVLPPELCALGDALRAGWLAEEHA